MPTKQAPIPPEVQISALVEDFRRMMRGLEDQHIANRAFLTSELDRRLDPISADLALLKMSNKTLVDGQAELQKDVTELKKDVSVLKKDVSEIKADLADVKRIVTRHDDQIVALESTRRTAKR